MNVNEAKFSDIYIISPTEVYIPDPRTANGLAVFEADDFGEFYTAVEQTYDGKNPSFSVNYKNILYRMERTKTIYGVQYCGRKMPEKVPPFSVLNFPPQLSKHLFSLSNKTGLILVSGPTGAGKTTTCSSSIKEFLSIEGGFAYTIEDPAEMPLDGVFNCLKGGLGVCKQTQPIDDKWGDSLKSALRSKPKFIFVGEIRTPETASEVLRAATSGHLVFSTIHANNITDAINSLIKYASSTEMSEDLAYDLFSRGMQCVLHQSLVGTGIKRPDVNFLFANPDNSKGCQVRGIIKSGKLNLATSIETQMTRVVKGIALFPDI